MRSARAVTASVGPTRHVIHHRTRSVSYARAVATAALLANATVAGAQMIAQVGVLRAATSTPDTVPSVTNVGNYRSSGLDVIARMGLGIVGTTGGTVAGGLLGAELAAGCRGEDCSVGGAVLGAAVGAVSGSAMMAAAPRMGSRCRRVQRIATGAAGALVGAPLGVVAGTKVEAGHEVFGFLAGTSLGSGIGTTICQ